MSRTAVADPTAETRIESLHDAVSFAEASALYRAVFGYAGPEDALNPRLLAALVANGGTAIGARDPSGELVGFCYGFPGRRDGVSFHYSQATVVAPGQRGQGLGRRLKLAQRAAAQRDGADRMRWAFDPALVRNARFNLDLLGAVGRWCVPDLYGLADPSPRMIVEWTFDAPARRAPSPPDGHVAGSVVRADGLTWLGFEPAQGSVALVERLAPLFADGHVAESCALVGGVGWYALRADDPSGRG